MPYWGIQPNDPPTWNVQTLIAMLRTMADWLDNYGDDESGAAVLREAAARLERPDIYE